MDNSLREGTRMAERFAGADGIRGLACLIVLCAHATAFFFPDFGRYFVGVGKIGVWLFFVLSAFLLTSKFERNGFSTGELAGYFSGRFLRIIPLFCIIIAIYWGFGTVGIDTSADVWRAVTFERGYAHLWTIPVEFKFYLLLPFIAFTLIAAKRIHGQAAAFLLCVAMVVGQQFAWPYWDTPESSILTRWYLPSFIIGCYAAISMAQTRKYVDARGATAVGVFVILVMFVFTPGARSYLFGMPFDRWLMDKFVYLSALWGLFLVFLVDGKGIVGAVLKSKIFVKLGAWSYSIYLVHWLIYVKLSVDHQNNFLWAIAALFLAVAFGAALYYFIESPIERFRHFLQSRIRLKMLALA